MYQLRDYQQAAVNSVFQYFESGQTGNPVIAKPTGTGKSLVIAGLVKETLCQWSNQRFLILTHVKELIEQNSQKMVEYWPCAPIGIYSASLKRRDTMQPVIFGGIASVNKKAHLFGHRDIVIVDECHLLSPNDATMYRQVIAELKRINPYLKVIGLSATPFRLGQGMITEGGLFTDICFNLCTMEGFNWLIDQGYLAPLIPMSTETSLDVSGVHMSRGDFNQRQLQVAVDKAEVTHRALQESLEVAHDRACWLFFASGVEHAEHIAEMLQTFGVSAAAVHSKMSDAERDTRIAAFKRGELRCIVNNNILTTGFDHPPIDYIGILKPTTSPGLWVQMLGRGTRPSLDTGKRNCLVSDFAGNTLRLGPINDPIIPKKKGKATGDAPVKICPECGCYNHTSARMCIACAYTFEFKTQLQATASTRELIKKEKEQPVVKHFDIAKVIYNLHQKTGSPPSVKVSYFCGLQMFCEWICPEHPGFAGKKARDWWRQRHETEPPATTAEFLQTAGNLRIPKRLRVHVNKKYPEVLGYEY